MAKEKMDTGPAEPNVVVEARQETENKQNYQEGLSNPVEGMTKKTRNVKQGIAFLSIALIIMVGTFYFIKQDLFGSGEPTQKPTSGGVIDVDDPRYAGQMQKIAELEEKIKTLQTDKLNTEKIIAERLNEESAKIIDIINAKTEGMKNIEILTETANKLAVNNTRIIESVQLLQNKMNEKETDGNSTAPEEREATEDDSNLMVLNTSATKIQEKEAYEQRAKELANKKPPFTVAAGMQMGTEIPAMLVNSISNIQDLDNFFAKAVTTQDIQITKTHYLPKGTVFLGKPVPDESRQKIVVNVTKLILQDTEMDVKGIFLDRRGQPGLVSRVYDPADSVAWKILLPTLLAGAATSLQEKEDYISNTQTGDVSQRPKNTLENNLLAGVGTTVNTFSQMQIERAMQKGIIIVVSANSPVKILLSERLPLSWLIEGQVAKDLTDTMVEATSDYNYLERVGQTDKYLSKNANKNKEIVRTIQIGLQRREKDKNR